MLVREANIGISAVQDKPQTLDHLEDNIRRVIADIRPQMLEKVIENWTSRLDYIRASRGSSMPWYWARTHDMPARIRCLDHWATAAFRKIDKVKQIYWEGYWSMIPEWWTFL
ncbi:hypothetical protein TNCV_2004541 [Trichonephila clavipes]|nr:hypothetical protein TNCV_2004541 [Trichonephila clavipes]